MGKMLLRIIDRMIDMKNKKLIGNPKQEGKWMLEEY
jgi:hypothetical protein